MGRIKDTALLEEYTAKDWYELCGDRDPEDVLNPQEYDAYLDWRQDQLDMYYLGDEYDL